MGWLTITLVQGQPSSKRAIFSTKTPLLSYEVDFTWNTLYKHSMSMVYKQCFLGQPQYVHDFSNFILLLYLQYALEYVVMVGI